MAIKSPVTQLPHVSLITRFPSDRIITLYQQEGIAVERFFRDIPAVELYECADTGYRFYSPENVFGDGQFYADLQAIEGGEYYSHKKWEHRFAAGQIKTSQKVLEVGAGDGFFLDILRQKGVAGLGLELNAQAIAAGRAKGLDLRNEMIADHAAQHPGEYDVVCCFQVLEHIYDVKGFLEACIKALNKAGKLIIGVPNNNPYLFKHDKWHTLNLPPHHAGLWNRKAFLQLQNFYEIVPDCIITEPLSHSPDQSKHWFLVQRDYHLEHHPTFGKVLAAIPRPLYKLGLKLFSPFIEGRNIVAMFTRK